VVLVKHFMIHTVDLDNKQFQIIPINFYILEGIL